MLEDVLRQIGQRERFVLTSHARPDGDAVGSALACCQVLRAMGKQADVVLHDGVPRIYRSLPYADQVVQSNRVMKRPSFWNATASTARGWKVWKTSF
jgi:phosphoesterase RecJ-like protein